MNFSKKVNGCFKLAFSNRCQNVSKFSDLWRFEESANQPKRRFLGEEDEGEKLEQARKFPKTKTFLRELKQFRKNVHFEQNYYQLELANCFKTNAVAKNTQISPFVSALYGISNIKNNSFSFLSLFFLQNLIRDETKHHPSIFIPDALIFISKCKQ